MRKILLVLYPLLLFYVSSFSQVHTLKHFDIEDGLAGNTIYDIIEDTLGYLWLGTDNGLSRYDGIEFKNFNDPILRNTDIIKITA